MAPKASTEHEPERLRLDPKMPDHGWRREANNLNIHTLEQHDEQPDCNNAYMNGSNWGIVTDSLELSRGWTQGR